MKGQEGLRLKAVLSSAIRFTLNLALANGKTLVHEIVAYTKLIEQLAVVLQISDQEGNIEYKADIMTLMRILTEKDDHCVKIGTLFPQLPELIARLTTQRFSPEQMSVDGLAVIRTWLRFPQLI